MHIYIVLASELFRVLSRNQWNRSNTWEQRSSKIVLNSSILIDLQYHRYGCTDFNVKFNTFPSAVFMLNQYYACVSLHPFHD